MGEWENGGEGNWIIFMNTAHLQVSPIRIPIGIIHGTCCACSLVRLFNSFIHLQQMSRHSFKYNKYCIVNFYCIHLFHTCPPLSLSPLFLLRILIDWRVIYRARDSESFVFLSLFFVNFLMRFRHESNVFLIECVS